MHTTIYTNILLEKLLNHNFSNPTNAKRYLIRYVNVIRSILQSNQTPKTFHVHHIIPKSWGGSDEPSNLIKVTYKQHVVLHHLLSKTDDPRMATAFRYMADLAKLDSQWNYIVSTNEYQRVVELETQQKANVLEKEWMILKTDNICLKS